MIVRAPTSPRYAVRYRASVVGQLWGRTRKGWKLWASVGLFVSAFFFTASSLATILSSPGSRWSISWAAVAWLAAGASLAVLLWTLLDSGTKH
jgi:dolichol kinase